MSEDNSEGVQPWKKVWVVVMFCILVVLLLGVIAYPALTGTSANNAMGLYVGYLDSPPMQVFWVALIVFVWAYILVLRKRIG